MKYNFKLSNIQIGDIKVGGIEVSTELSTSEMIAQTKLVKDIIGDLPNIIEDVYKANSLFNTRDKDLTKQRIKDIAEINSYREIVDIFNHR